MSDNPTQDALLLERLGQFIQFERDVRAADTQDAIDFIACNQTRRFFAFDTAMMLHLAGKRLAVRCVAGVSTFDHQAPLIQQVEAAVNGNCLSACETIAHTAQTLDAPVAEQLELLQAGQLLQVGLDDRSAMVFLRQRCWQPADQQLATQSAEVVAHAMQALRSERGKRRRPSAGVRWFAHPWRWTIAALLLLACLPVRQSVIAGGEITAAEPQVVAAGLDGVVADVLVRPNQAVERGQLLLRFDATEIDHRLSTVRHELLLAEEQLRKARQMSLSAPSQGARLAELESQVELTQLELAHVESLHERLELRARKAGIVMFSRRQDWLGRAVATGEKIMEVAVDGQREFEIWLAVGDAIDLAEGALVKFFPDAFPLDALSGELDNVSFFAQSSPDETLAYRVVASVAGSEEHLKLGMKGTARLYGEHIALGYYLLRKPLATLRRTLGI